MATSSKFCWGAGEALGREGGVTVALPLYVAAQVGPCRPIEQLLQAGAGFSVVDARGGTPLHYCCKFVGSVGTAKDTRWIIKRLLLAGANVNVVDARGRTPLHHACLSPVLAGIAEDTWPIDRLLLVGPDVSMLDGL